MAGILKNNFLVSRGTYSVIFLKKSEALEVYSDFKQKFLAGAVKTEYYVSRGTFCDFFLEIFEN